MASNQYHNILHLDNDRWMVINVFFSRWGFDYSSSTLKHLYPKIKSESCFVMDTVGKEKKLYT